ncbi:carbohydrate-binding protein [Streptacidiphilus sp. P02-A3a]|uniref:carbohydrate-binding protein n=1 Tax=Streptacidiphilus sp. P02-A3a TaxID=2704468 RepID=UPI0015FC0D3C|nr:carbohydrate-binding protein [Streptacidiphilus sp. P02-A3a]QMU67462.1 carbohydrate-binding protein [Streptacidiphilus sp. P02-A3a]
MTAEDNGVPEDDDPFAYLYRGQEGEDARNAAQQPGAPRTSYQQATQVGRMQYGQPRQQPGGQQAPQYQQQYQQQAPPQQQTSPLPPTGGGRAQSRSGGSSRGVTYGAVGVVLAVVIGIGVALLNSGGDKSPVASPSNSPVTSASTDPSASSTPSASAPAALPGATNVSGMTLGGGAVPTNNHTGAASTDGKFVPLTASGMSITWSNVSVPTAGSYTFWVHYANAGGGNPDPFTLTVDGKALPLTINLKNWSGSTSWDQAWQRSYTPVTLNAGSNTIEVSYATGSNAGVNVDQLAVTVSSSTPPWP